MMKTRTGIFAILFAVGAIAVMPASQAANVGGSKLAKVQEVTKQRLVLMPLQLIGMDEGLRGKMEEALSEGLQDKYEVIAYQALSDNIADMQTGEQDKQSTLKVGVANTDCAETIKLKEAANSSLAELFASAGIVMHDGGYFLTLSIKNILSKSVIYAKALPCKECDAFQLAEQTKFLARATAQGAIAATDEAIKIRQELEPLQREQLAFRKKLREANFIERKRLLEVKAREEEQAKTKVLSEVRKGDEKSEIFKAFPTVQAAAAELMRLNAQISAIDARYKKELAPIRKQVDLLYADKFDELDEEKRKKGESEDSFKEKQEMRRIELGCQRDAKMAILTPASLATDETAPLRKRVKELSATEYALDMGSLNAKLGQYNAELQQFPIAISSKSPGISLPMSAVIPLPSDASNAFKAQWDAGQIRLEAKVKPGASLYSVDMLNDADHSRWTFAEGAFMSASARSRLEMQTKELQKREDVYRPMMVKIPQGQLSGTPVKAFWMAATEVTQAQWMAVMGSNPSYFQGGDLPVGNVSWNDVQEYIVKLNKLTGKQYRLPTGVEWEYACSAGSQTKFCGGDDVDELAWSDANSNNLPHPVGLKHGNDYGLYDMSGNVIEWTNECWGKDCIYLVLRGGSLFSQHALVRADKRIRANVADREIEYGFRLALTLR